MKYENFQYIFPPRPKNAVDSKDLDFWDNESMISQPKLNGSNCVIFTNGERLIMMNRHGQPLSNASILRSEVLSLFRGTIGKWMVLNGEYLNKAKMDENLQNFNHKLVIFDILVYNSEYLVGKTFKERIDLLDSLYGTEDSEKSYLFSISESIYRVKSFYSDFKSIFDNLTKIDMVEGLVLKRSNAKLEVGASELNNTKSQIKTRKKDKNFKY